MTKKTSVLFLLFIIAVSIAFVGLLFRAPNYDTPVKLFQIGVSLQTLAIVFILRRVSQQ